MTFLRKQSNTVMRYNSFRILSYFWDNETVPEDFTTVKIIMMFKHKGSHNDQNKYRCIRIGLLNHMYKDRSHIMMTRLLVGFQRDS